MSRLGWEETYRDAYIAVDVDGHTVRVDRGDARLLTQGWGVYKVRNKFYIMGKRSKVTTYLHREIAGARPGEKVIFKDLDTLNLRRSNLLVTTQNIEATRAGLRATSASGFKGVTWNKKREKWEARFSQTVDGVRRHEHLGYHDDPNDAARAYDRRLVEAHGPGAVTNERLGLL